MSRLSNRELRLLGVWCVLATITLMSLESIHLKGWIRDERFQGVAVIILAFLKVRLIMLDFMEIRQAPAALRIVMELWVAIACGGLILFLLGVFP